MKNHTTITAIIICVVSFLLIHEVSAQQAQKISYQALVRNSANDLVTNQQVGMKISILQGSPTGNVVYTETIAPSTNGNGVVSIEIGGGVGFSSLSWANSPYFIKTEIDTNGGTNYSITGTSQLLNVPYAFHSKTSQGVVYMTQFQIETLTPVAGLIVYNTTSKELIFYNGTLWKSILN
ncbi:MAG: hypothetical protein ACOYMD_16100 [Paludibacter sp.]